MTSMNVVTKIAPAGTDRELSTGDGPIQEQEAPMTAVSLEEESIVLEIFRMLEPHNKSGIPIQRHTDIMKDLDVDSLAVMNFIMNLEDHFDVSIPLNAMAEIRTVEDLANTVLKMKSGS